MARSKVIEIDITTKRLADAIEDPALDALLADGWRIASTLLTEQQHAETGATRQVLSLLMTPPAPAQAVEIPDTVTAAINRAALFVGAVGLVYLLVLVASLQGNVNEADIMKAGPVTDAERYAISRLMLGEGWRCTWYRERGRNMIRVVGDDDLRGSFRAAGLIADICPRAVIEAGSGLADGIQGQRKWQLVVWVDPPAEEYMRRELAGIREHG